MRKIIFLLLAGLMPLSVYAGYTGRVFVDKNGNGVYDKEEKPLKGVCVSDGLNVVATAADGSFTLPGHGKERFIFITAPSGYRTVGDYYIRIGEGGGTYDFGLQPYGNVAKDGSHSYIHISDTEIFNTEGHGDWTGNLRDYVANEKAAFIVHTGDICYENGLKKHIEIMNNRNMGCPVYYCIGNHDLVKGEYGEELFESLYGPVFYSFDMGSVHYIVTPMLGGDYRPSYRRADVYNWLKNDLAHVPKDKSVVVFNHDLLTYDNDRFVYYGADENEQINLNDHNLKAWVFGHWHINYIKKQGDVYAVSTATLDKGGIDHSTSAFRVMHADRNGGFTSELRYTYLDKNICIASPGEGAACAVAGGTVPLTVNVYSSATPVREVVYSCEADGKMLFKDRRMKQRTDWTWNTGIPLTPKEAGKTVTVKVTARFGNGEEANAERTFRYTTEQWIPGYSDDWDNLLGNPEHIGIAASGLNAPLRLAWVKNVGANIFMTSPLIHKGNIYTASVDENYKGEAHVYALDGRTGDVLWKHKARNSVKNTIVIEKDILFAQDAEGYVYALDVSDGRLLWDKRMPVNGLPAVIEGLVAKDGVVYAGTGKGLCALNVEDGTVIWRNEGWGQGEGATSTMTFGGGVLIGSAQWHALYANDAGTGELKWRISANGMNYRGASAAIHGNLLYIISHKSLFVIEKDNGNVVARRDYPFSVDVTSTPLLTDKEIIFGTVYEGLVAVDRETFDVKWKFKTGDALVYTASYVRGPASSVETSPVLSGNTVYAGASDGTVYGINKDDGKLVWKHETGAPVFTSVAVSGNTLVFADFGGNVYAFIASEDEE